MKFDYFVASRWRNKTETLRLVSALYKLGKNVYSFADPKYSVLRESSDSEDEMKAFEAIPNWQQNPIVRKIFDKDLRGLRESREFIMLMPSGKSAHMEAGIAYGLGKRCILIGHQKETESLYLVFSKTFSTIESFIKSIK